MFFFNLSLTEKNMHVKFGLKISVYLLGLEIRLLHIFFNLIFHFGVIRLPP